MRENNLTHDFGACEFKNCCVGDTDREETMKPITDRLPTKEDATKYSWLVWVYLDGEWLTCVYSLVKLGQHWAPIESPPIPELGPAACAHCKSKSECVSISEIRHVVVCKGPCAMCGPEKTTREAAIEAWEQLRQPEWQPIETAPEEERVLLLNAKGYHWASDMHEDATHWMPLPKGVDSHTELPFTVTNPTSHCWKR